MTPPDHDPLLDDGPLDDDTLAVHAVVDDEATAEQRRRVARDPELVARVAALRAVIEAVAEPVDPPPTDVLAEIRRRALAAALDQPEVEDRPTGDEPAPAPPTLPVRDLGAARARRTRTLPPFPAVAAVVVLLVVVGVGLLLAGTSGQDDSGGDLSSADAGGAEAGSDGGGDDAAEAPTAAADEGLDAQEGERPADELRDELLARATASYASQADLEADLRRADVDPLALAGSPDDGPENGTDGEGDQTTTAPPTTTAPASGSSTEAADDSAAAFAADPVATRCDDVLRSAEPDLEPAVAAVLVEVDGVPILVLSNPTEVSDQAPSGLRLTALNAVDCSPRAAVLR